MAQQEIIYNSQRRFVEDDSDVEDPSIEEEVEEEEGDCIDREAEEMGEPGSDEDGDPEATNDWETSGTWPSKNIDMYFDKEGTSETTKGKAKDLYFMFTNSQKNIFPKSAAASKKVAILNTHCAVKPAKAERVSWMIQKCLAMVEPPIKPVRSNSVNSVVMGDVGLDLTKDSAGKNQQKKKRVASSLPPPPLKKTKGSKGGVEFVVDNWADDEDEVSHPNIKPLQTHKPTERRLTKRFMFEQKVAYVYFIDKDVYADGVRRDFIQFERAYVTKDKHRKLHTFNVAVEHLDVFFAQVEKAKAQYAFYRKNANKNN